MKLSRTLILPALAAVAFGGAFAVAQGPGKPHQGGDRPNMTERFDLNGDGDISRDEVETVRTDRFASVDASGDGAITFEEFTAFADAERAERMASRQQQMSERADANGDGVLTFDETGGREAGMFERADANGDGVITEAERESLREQMRERGGERRRFQGNPENE